MKKWILFSIVILTACSNIDKKEHYYNNAIKLNVVFSRSLQSFERAYLRIDLWSENEKLLDEKIVYDISHKFGNTNNKNILVNFKNFDKNQNTKVTVELFADVNSDEIMESYMGIIRENSDKTQYIYDIR